MFGISKKKHLDQKAVTIFHYEDYAADDVSEALVGRKGESLFKLKDMDVPVPAFFVVSPSVYKSFLLGAFDNKLAKLLEKVKSPDIKELERFIEEADFDDEFLEDLYKQYARVSGFTDTWVAVRSSVVYPKNDTVSFSSIFETELNVRGMDHLVESLKKIYISVFKNSVVLYAQKHRVDLTELQMAVVVQKMVQPEVSGVAYTIDPVTEDDTKMGIEAVFGLGDVISDGSVTPDQYQVNKSSLDILEKNISPQEWMKVRKPGKAEDGLQEYEKIQISKTWSHQQKLEDRNLREVAKISQIIEKKAKAAQNVEWVWESGNVWILQSKPLLKEEHTKPELDTVTTEETPFDVALDLVKEEKMKESASLSEVLGKRNVKEANQKIEEKAERVEKELSTLDKLSRSLKSIGGSKRVAELEKEVEAESQAQAKIDELKDSNTYDFLLTGIGSSQGQSIGEVIKVGEIIPDDLVITKDHILLISKYTDKAADLVMRSGGVLMDDGGLTSDASIIAREAGVPAVVGTGLATSLIKTGDVLKLDGNVGSVYKVVKSSDEVRERIDPSILAAAERAKLRAMKEAQKENSEVTKVRAEDTEKSKKDEVHNEEITPKERIATATKVLLTPEDPIDADRYRDVITIVDGICYIDLDEIFLADKRHPIAYVEDKKFKEYSKRIEQLLDDYTDALGSHEVVVSIGSATVSRFKSLVKGSSMESKDIAETSYGVSRLLANKKYLKKSLGIVKRVRNVYKSRNLSLAIHSPMTGEMMKELKKEISAMGLRRTGTFNIYAVIDNSAEVILTEDLLQAGLDGVIINTPRIARLMQGLDMYDPKAKYDIDASSVRKVVLNSVNQAKAEKARVIVVTEESSELIKEAIRWGVYGVAVKPSYYEAAKTLVSDEEAKMIMGINITT